MFSFFVRLFFVFFLFIDSVLFLFYHHHDHHHDDPFLFFYFGYIIFHLFVCLLFVCLCGNFCLSFSSSSSFCCFTNESHLMIMILVDWKQQPEKQPKKTGKNTTDVCLFHLQRQRQRQHSNLARVLFVWWIKFLV